MEELISVLAVVVTGAISGWYLAVITILPETPEIRPEDAMGLGEPLDADGREPLPLMLYDAEEPETRPVAVNE